ncbi:hypothetical protein BH23ACT6_BH23ACT6_15090 [soil metagenome]
MSGDVDSVPVLLHLLEADTGLPSRAHPGDAGLDLHASTGHTLQPGRRATVGTGVALALPAGYAAYVLPRSGLAAKHGITVLNAPGTVDAGYRGEVKVTLLNTDPEVSFTISPGDRIAQMVVQPVHEVAFHQVDRLPGSARGVGGHGSSGGYGGTTPTPAAGSTEGEQSLQREATNDLNRNED